jgi:hypothetical protein
VCAAAIVCARASTGTAKAGADAADVEPPARASEPAFDEASPAARLPDWALAAID